MPDTIEITGCTLTKKSFTSPTLVQDRDTTDNGGVRYTWQSLEDCAVRQWSPVMEAMRLAGYLEVRLVADRLHDIEQHHSWLIFSLPDVTFHTKS